MTKHKFCCIGYITKDKIITPQSSVNMPGGTAFYISEAISHLDSKDYLLVTAVEDGEQKVVEDMKCKGIEVVNVHTAKSVCFENIYGENQNERKQRVTALPDPFTIKKLEGIDAEVIHLGSLLHDDFPLDVIKSLSEKSILSADVQGFLRKVVDKKVVHIDWDEKMEALKYIHILKANEQEMEVITGTDDPYEAALILADWGVKEILLTLGDKGSIIYTKGEFNEIPAYPTLKVVDATGCGDTYMAGYIYMREKGASVYDAGCFAAAMCTIKLQAHGPFCGSEETVKRIMRSEMANCALPK